MKRGLVVIAASCSALVAGCASTPAPPALVCPNMQSLSKDWQKEWAAEGRDAQAKRIYPRLREGATYWAALRRQLKNAGCK